MLQVLKRRWKPKRAAANNNNNNNNTGGRLEVEVPLEKHRNPTSPRQIHPVCEEKLHLVAYECDLETLAPPGGGLLYPLTPNICVEGGRIEFIKPPPGVVVESNKVSTDEAVTPPPEKTDIAKECLEAKVQQLEAALEAEKKVAQRERLLAAKLQRQLARREVLQRDVDRERRLRLDSNAEAERCRARLATLQREFSRMEETVRSMLQYKTRYDHLKQDKHQLTTAYETRVQQFQTALSKLNQENEALKKQLHSLEAAGAGEVQAALIERLRVLERDNSNLTREGELVRHQYERCLDDVANQVVKALLAQKGLREEISTLQQRVRELEAQNHTLTSLLLQQLTTGTVVEPPKPQPTIKFALTAPGRPASCDDARLRLWEESVVWLPLQRPTSLSLESCCQYRHRAPVPQLGNGKEEDEGSESPESGNRDEGYSTMSSDVQGLTEAPRRGLEELKEASDETDTLPLALDTVSSSPDRLPEPDIVLIPLSFALSVSSPSNRNSFPPVKDILPFQHVMRSFSDSHLCLHLLSPSTESILPLRRARPTSSLQASAMPEEEDDAGSWCSGDWWDADYVQHWQRLEETRSTLQRQMEYDAAELEDWTMEEEGWRRGGSLTHSQTLPSIQESEGAELDDDCLWTSSSYFVDQMATGEAGDAGRGVWSYNNRSLISPGGDSWSSGGTNSEDSRSINDCVNGSSKRSSAAMSTDSGELPAVGTDFTRDFYRLVKFESTKSLASTSSRSQAGDSIGLRRGDIPVSIPLSTDREQALQSVLHFIAEQQQYVRSREVMDIKPSEISFEEISPHSDVSSTKENCEEIIQVSVDVKQENSNQKSVPRSEGLLNDYNTNLMESQQSENTISTVNETLLDHKSQKESLVPIDKPVNKLENLDESMQRCSMNVQERVKSTEHIFEQSEPVLLLGRTLRVDINRSGLRPVPEEDEDHPAMSESFTSTISTPETVLKYQPDLEQSLSLPDSTDSTSAVCSDEPILVSGAKSISFHEHATSKDVIEELNRMIRKGEESGDIETTDLATNLDMACCCPTGWVHVERDIDFTDPKTRANLLDVMLAASHSSSSSSTSSNSDSGEEPSDYQHLHRLHRFRRQKKASAFREPLGVLRCASLAPRVSIIGRDDFFVRYGDKEREAVASFDFLEELSTASVSGASSCDQRDASPTTDSEHNQLSLSDSCAASFSSSEHSLDVQ